MRSNTLTFFPFVLQAVMGKPCATTTRSASPTAIIDTGKVVGIATKLPNAPSLVNKFLGIPFAGKTERFTFAKPPKAWGSPLKATEFGASCPQYYIENELVMDPETMKKLAYGDADPPPESDDCLFVNVFAPASSAPKSEDKGKAVLLYIHGGGWHLGNGLSDLSDFAANEDVVAVSFNYRTNIFGFPNAPEIPLKERNLGLHDQHLAIEWVQKNIAAFGGDPARVTLWGVSAGSMSIDDHLHAYRDEEELPFQSVIQSSGQASWGWLASTSNASNTSQWPSVARQLGCGEDSSEDEIMTCMRDASIEALKNASANAQGAYSPVVDEVTVTSHQAKAWRHGDIARVPILTSTTWEEGRGLINKNLDLKTFMAAYFPDELVPEKTKKAVVSYYKAKPGLETDFDLASAIYTDFFFHCGQALEAEASATLDSPTWRFIFNQTILELLPDEFSYLGKFHGSDLVLLLTLPYIENAEGTGISPELIEFGKYFRRTLAAFVKDPMAGPGWPRVGTEDVAPFDIAVLGQKGDEEFAGAKMINKTEADEACRMYEPLYKILEEYILS